LISNTFEKFAALRTPVCDTPCTAAAISRVVAPCSTLAAAIAAGTSSTQLIDLPTSAVAVCSVAARLLAGHREAAPGFARARRPRWSRLAPTGWSAPRWIKQNHP
jgi:hypothetical protein